MLLARSSSAGDWHENSCLSVVKVGRRLADVEGYYALLGIAPDADDDEVKRAGKVLVMQTHPDHGGDEESFIEAVTAYKTLSNPSSRAEYDARTSAPTATVREPAATFEIPFSSSGCPAWYKEPTLLLDDEEVLNVRRWHELLLEEARGFRQPLEIKAGVCRCPTGYYVEGDIAVIGRGQVPERWAARVFILMKMCERKEK